MNIYNESKINKPRKLNQYFTITLTGYCTPNQKLACFVLYLKIVDTFKKNNIYASCRQLSKELKNGITIQISQAVLELLIKHFWLFWSINRLADTKMSVPFLRVGQFTILHYFSEKCW